MKTLAYLVAAVLLASCGGSTSSPSDGAHDAAADLSCNWTGTRCSGCTPGATFAPCETCVNGQLGTAEATCPLTDGAAD